MKYLLITPHPDDLEISCAVLVQKLIQDGHIIRVIVVTSGELAGDPKAREQEAIAGCKLLGLPAPSFLRFPQLKMPENRIKFQKVLEEIVKDYKPDSILTPWEKDIMEDHSAISQISLVAGRSVRNIYFYPTPSSYDFIPDTVVFGSKAMLDKKYESLALHKTQVDTGRMDPKRVYSSSENALHQFSHHSLKTQNNIQTDHASAELFKVFRQELITAL
jgi:LmbE family N-acetylglucosaminyl deacetylase